MRRLAEKQKTAIIITLIFLSTMAGFYLHYDNSLNAKIEAYNYSSVEESDKVLKLNITNLEKDSIKPDIVILRKNDRRPIETKISKLKTIAPQEKVEIEIKIVNQNQIPKKKNYNLSLILRDTSSQKSLSEKITINKKIKKFKYQNPELATYKSKPIGWQERFKGDIDKYSIQKTFSGVKISLDKHDDHSYFKYYLTQRFNLSKKLNLVLDYSKLEDAEAGFRILDSSSSPGSEQGVIDIELTNYTGRKSNQLNRTFDLERLYQEQNKHYEKGKVVQIQLFFESNQDTPNSIHWKEASIGNQ